MLGQTDFSLIPVSFSDRVTLFYGPSSLQEGAGALGGSVLLESVPLWESPQIIQLTQAIGSFNTYKTSATIQLGKKKVRARLKIFSDHSENNFSFYNDENGLWNQEIQENAAYKKYGILGEVFIRPDSKNTYSLHGWSQYSDRDLPAIMSYEGMGRLEQQADQQS